MNDVTSVSLKSPVNDPHRLWGLGEVLKLAWPASLSMLSHTVMMFFDGIMVASIGPDPLGAQFVGGIASFIPAAFMLGVLSVVNTYVSQNLGAERLNRCGQYAWAGMAVAFVFAIFAQLLMIPAGSLMQSFGHGLHAAQLEAMYFRYMVLGLIPMLTSKVLEQFFFGLGRSNVVLLASFLANVFNIFANWLLIYGHWGFPALGLEGAAIGTVLGATLMLAVMAVVFFSRKINERYATRKPSDMKLRECVEILRIGWPAGVQFCADVLAWGMITAYLIGNFGMDHLAANTTAIRYMAISFMPAVGIGIATTALVGRYIGEARPDLALRRVRAALIAAMVYMGVCGLFFFLFRYDLVRFYITVVPNDGMAPDQIASRVDQITHIGGRLLMCAAIFQVFDAAAIIYNGALRGAGDTLWPMITTIILCWIFQVGGGFLVVKQFPELNSLGPWVSASLFIIMLAVVFCWRFEGGSWRKIDLLKRGREEVSLPPTDSTLEV